MKLFTHILVVFAVLALLFGASAKATSASSGNHAQQEAQGWARFLEKYGPSHASGQRPELGPTIRGNPTQAVLTLKIGLHYSYTPSGSLSEFYSLDHPFVQLSNTEGVAHVLDESTGKKVATMHPGEQFEVSYNDTGYSVSGPDGVIGTFDGPILFQPTNGQNLFSVDSIKRIDIITYAKYITPKYRGEMEIARGPSTSAGKVNLVNIIGLKDYVRGVVVNESPAFFDIEALKGQAVAARGYAVANVGGYEARGYPFDLTDSPASQVYRGETSEHPRGNQAVEETQGLVASYQGKIINALYSSSMGGHTENVEWIFPSPSDQLPGDNAVPYLQGIYDSPAGTTPDLTTEAGIREFWMNPQPQVYDSYDRVNNRFNRWTFDIPADVIQDRLAGHSEVVSGSISGDITRVEVTERMAASKRVAVARVYLTGGVVDVKGWDDLRRVFGRTASSVPSIFPGASPIPAGFTLDNPGVIDSNYDASDNFTGVTVYGGGWGHNVGMSQYGANGRGKAGQNFVQILKAYYTGVDIGSYPIDISAQSGGPRALRQQFGTPTGQGTLVVQPRGLKGLNVVINDTYSVKLSDAQLSQDEVRIDIGQYLHPGTNVIQYVPSGNGGSATVLVIVA